MRKRNFQKDRDYDSNIFNGENNNRRKLLVSKYKTIQIDENEKRWD